MPKLDDALKRVASTRPSARERGYQELLSLGEKDRVLRAAIEATDAVAIDVACAAFFPESPELLRALITTQRGPDATLVPRYHLPMGNYLYAEDLIVKHYSGQAKRMAVDTVEGLGLAGMSGMAPVFRKLLELPIDNAIEEMRPPARPTYFPDKYDAPPPGHDHLSGKGRRALAALVALHQTGLPADDAVLQRMDGDIARAFAGADVARRYWQLKLNWARFDAGYYDDLAVLADQLRASTDIAPDLATTLLKRGRMADLDALLARFDSVYFLPRGFVHWPLANYLETHGLRQFIMPPPECILVAEDSYARARHLGLAPPPWWVWR